MIERYRYAIKHIDGRLEYADGATAQEAIKALGWTLDEVRRFIPAVALHKKKAMSEATKKLLAERHALRRSVRAPKRRRK